MSDTAPSTKGERTRARIRDAALRSFKENGYDATTIRKIADELGLSVGATNYHFASKQDLIQELYLDVQDAHRVAADPQLAHTADLIERLAIVFDTGLDQLAPYRDHASEIVTAAISPRSPINPLAAESADSLASVQSLFADAITGSTGARIPSDVQALLPKAFVLAHLLLALFWTYDSSPHQARTRRLTKVSLTLFARALPFLRVPLVRRPLVELLQLVDGIGQSAGNPA